VFNKLLENRGYVGLICIAVILVIISFSALIEFPNSTKQDQTKLKPAITTGHIFGKVSRIELRDENSSTTVYFQDARRKVFAGHHKERFQIDKHHTIHYEETPNELPQIVAIAITDPKRDEERFRENEIEIIHEIEISIKEERLKDRNRNQNTIPSNTNQQTK